MILGSALSTPASGEDVQRKPDRGRRSCEVLVWSGAFSDMEQSVPTTRIDEILRKYGECTAY